jgi:hypothetical protein
MSPPIVSTLEKAHGGRGQGRGRGHHGEQGKGHPAAACVIENNHKKESWIVFNTISHQDTHRVKN